MENVRVRKLTLDLNELEVESFDPSPSLQDQRGTVKGQTGEETCYTCTTCGMSCGQETMCMGYSWCGGETCEPSWCYATCYTCIDTCAMSCGQPTLCMGYTWCGEETCP